MTSTRPISSLKYAITIGIAAAIGASAASPSWAATSWSSNVSETGWQSDLVNRPGCWTENGHDNWFPCQVH